jgi:hypothetical protein
MRQPYNGQISLTLRDRPGRDIFLDGGKIPLRGDHPEPRAAAAKFFTVSAGPLIVR